MRRRAILMTAVMGAALAGCGGEGAAVDSSPSSNATATTAVVRPAVPKVTIRAIRREQKTGKAYKVDVEYAELSGVSPSVEEAANARFRAEAEKEVEAFIKDVTERDEACDGDSGCTGTLEVTVTPTLVSSEAISLRVSGSVYPPGAAHLSHITAAKTIDTRDGHEVALGELFSGEPRRYLSRLSRESRPRVLAEMEEDCRKQFEENEEGLAPDADNFAAWTLTSGGLEIGFGEYQLASYACGTQVIVIPWTVLARDLSANGRRLSGT